MGTNLVLQKLISHQKDYTITKQASTVASQSMVNGKYVFHTLESAMQHNKWAWTASHPTQRPVKPPSTVLTLPTSSPWGVSSVSVSSGFPLSVGMLSAPMAGGLIWSRCRVEKKKVGGRWEKKSTLSQCLRMVVKHLLVQVETLFYSVPCLEWLCSRVSWKESCSLLALIYVYQMSYSVNIPTQFIGANLVLLISHKKDYTITKQASTVASQSMVNGKYVFHTLESAMQHNKWAWTASNPTQRPVKLPFTVPTLPTSLSVSSVFTSSVVLSLSGMAPDLIWSRCRVEKKKVGWATGRQVGEKVNTQPMLEDGGEGWWRFLRLRYYSILFPCKNCFPLEYTRCHIQYSPPIYESKFGVTTTEFRPKQHTTTKHAHIHFWSLHG